MLRKFNLRIMSFWNNLDTISTTLYWMAVGIAVLGFIALVLQRRQMALQAQGDKVKDAAIAAANVAAASANERAGLANERAVKAEERASSADLASSQATLAAAEATQRAAGLEKEAAEAKLEFVKLQSVVAWRTISEQQKQDFATFLAFAPKGEIVVTRTSQDPETANYALLIADMLTRAGYTGAPRGQVGLNMTSGVPAPGVFISVLDLRNAIAGPIQQGFAKTGIKAEGIHRPSQRDPIEILVGPKPQ
jgi:hypothetical protein